MKKVAIGCAVIAGLMVLVLGIGTYYITSKFRAVYEDLAQISELNEQIADQRAYSPPADRRMTARQVEQYVGVQQVIRDRLGRRFNELDEKYGALSRALQDEERDPSIRELVGVWTDVLSLVMDAKRAQVDALNEAHMSLSEYHWIRQQTLMALGYGAFGWNLETLVEDPTRMLETAAPADSPDTEALQHNRALLQEYEDSIEEWLAISFFGL